jgi:hypothetical protein
MAFGTQPLIGALSFHPTFFPSFPPAFAGSHFGSIDKIHDSTVSQHFRDSSMRSQEEHPAKHEPRGPWLCVCEDMLLIQQHPSAL